MNYTYFSFYILFSVCVWGGWVGGRMGVFKSVV